MPTTKCVTIAKAAVMLLFITAASSSHVITAAPPSHVLGPRTFAARCSAVSCIRWPEVEALHCSVADVLTRVCSLSVDLPPHVCCIAEGSQVEDLIRCFRREVRHERELLAEQHVREAIDTYGGCRDHER